MERALKERIVGAVILVALAVLVVPVFLDGPPESGEVVTERMPLPGQSDQETQTVVLARDRDEPVPAPPRPASRETAPDRAGETGGASEPATGGGSAAEPRAESGSEPAPAPEPAEPARSGSEDAAGAAAGADSATGMWAVQLGSFSEQDNAERLAADLRKQNYAAFLSRLTTSSGELHRVRVGPLEDREAAEAMARRLADAGHPGQVVPHP